MVVRQYLKWMEQAPAGRRAEAVDPLVRAYFIADVSEREREAMEAAMTILLDDPSPDVRRALAQSLARHEDAPRHLIIALTQDRPEVAAPVLARSPVLLDAELVDAVATGTDYLQQAIAGRPVVSPPVSAAIVEVAGPEAIAVLLRNAAARLGLHSFQRLAERFGDDAEIRTLMFARVDLPIVVRQALIRRMSERLGERAAKDSWMPPRRIEALVRDACDKATCCLVAGAGEADRIALVEHLRGTGQLTTSLLVRVMCAGHMHFFEAALSSLAAMPAPRVYSILAEGRESSLRALFARAGLPERSHPAFIAALDVWRDLDFDGRPGDQYRFSRRMIERILTRYEDFTRSDLDDLLTMLRRLAAEAAREAARGFVEEYVRTPETPAVTAREGLEDEAEDGFAGDDMADEELFEDARPEAVAA